MLNLISLSSQKIMDPSTTAATPPPYEQFSSSNIQVGISIKKSESLIGCGIALIITSFINTIVSLSIMIIVKGEGILTIYFMFDILHLLMGMLTVYGSYNIQERQQTIVSAMIWGILTSTVKGPLFITGLVFAFKEKYLPGLIIISSILTGTNCCLSIAISIIVCKKVCACCQRRNPTYIQQMQVQPVA